MRGYGGGLEVELPAAEGHWGLSRTEARECAGRLLYEKIIAWQSLIHHVTQSQVKIKYKLKIKLQNLSDNFGSLQPFLLSLRAAPGSRSFRIRHGLVRVPSLARLSSLNMLTTLLRPSPGDQTFTLRK